MKRRKRIWQWHLKITKAEEHPMNKQILFKLLDGQFICPVAFPEEFRALQDYEIQQETNVWLNQLGQSLIQIDNDGAFYMAPQYPSEDDNQRYREEMQNCRNTLMPSIQMLDMIRKCCNQFHCQPDATIELAQLEMAVNSSTELSNTLKALQANIKDANLRHSHRENLSKLLSQLAKEGYIKLINEQAGIYKVTGKIEYLHQVIAAMIERMPAQEGIDTISEEAVAQLIDANGQVTINAYQGD